jgi:3-hydroxyacyl-[acyl-carrier-protein] dehydratase
VRYLLVDRIVELERGRRATGIKNVTMSEDFLTDHFPEQPVMPGVLIAESLVQLADWVVRESSGFQCIGLASSFERLRFRHFVLPGDQLRLEVEILSQEGAQATVKGKAYRGDQLVTSAEFTLGLHSAAEHVSAEESRHQFEIIRPGGNGVVPGGN